MNNREMYLPENSKYRHRWAANGYIHGSVTTLEKAANDRDKLLGKIKEGYSFEYSFRLCGFSIPYGYWLRDAFPEIDEQLSLVTRKRRRDSRIYDKNSDKT